MSGKIIGYNVRSDYEIAVIYEDGIVNTEIFTSMEEMCDYLNYLDTILEKKE